MNKNKVHHYIYQIDLVDSKVSDKQLLSDTFNSYFVEQPNNIHTSILNSTSHYHYLTPTHVTSMPFFYATVEEVLETITSMNKHCDIDDIPTKVLQLSKNFIAEKT